LRAGLGVFVFYTFTRCKRVFARLAKVRFSLTNAILLECPFLGFSLVYLGHGRSEYFKIHSPKLVLTYPQAVKF